MDFLSLEYGTFLLALTGVYWCIPSVTVRLLLLLTASLFFYALLQLKFVWLLLVNIGLNLMLGRKIYQSTGRSQRRWLVAGIAYNLALLLVFKYVPFLATTLGNVTGWRGAFAFADWARQNIVTPVSISFFAFEMIAYLVNVARGQAPAQDVLSFAVYETLFMKMRAGPIVRYQDFLPQLRLPRWPQTLDLVEGVWLIAVGVTKKALMADNLGRFVDLSLENMERGGSWDLWLVLVAYGLQIYGDFSGYIDMARGSALLLGFRLPQNFDFPYFATSIADFWRRWHMTLGHWVRDYLYIPLGGSRQGTLITCGNLLVVMTLVGIWHGANWGFIIWGIWHGFALAMHRLGRDVATALPERPPFWATGWGQALALILTQGVVLVGWLPFRLPNLTDTGLMLSRLWGKGADPQYALKVYVEAMGLSFAQISLLTVGAIAVMAVAYRCDRAKLHLAPIYKMALVPLALYAAALLSPSQTVPFIYFDF
ncbi:MAG: MBOAT family protein [Oscillatoriales cyanobacterium SM2_1_8]|nr:MBOAT family protein [Oscillatoriales cyanobacterium SM2_1_8]